MEVDSITAECLSDDLKKYRISFNGDDKDVIPLYKRDIFFKDIWAHSIDEAKRLFKQDKNNKALSINKIYIFTKEAIEAERRIQRLLDTPINKNEQTGEVTCKIDLRALLDNLHYRMLY